MSDEITRLPDDDVDGDEGWVRTTDDPDLRDLEALRDEDEWQVIVAMAEFVREDPLEGELREGIASALRGVPGVTNVEEQDREIWLVEGDATGEALLGAASVVVDQLAARVRTHLDEEGS